MSQEFFLGLCILRSHNSIFVTSDESTLTHHSKSVVYIAGSDLLKRIIFIVVHLLLRKDIHIDRKLTKIRMKPVFKYKMYIHNKAEMDIYHHVTVGIL